MPSVAVTDYSIGPAAIVLRAIDRLSIAPDRWLGLQRHQSFHRRLRLRNPWRTPEPSFVDGVRVVTGGTITSILVNFDPTPALTMTGLSLNAATLQGAILANANGTPDAFQALFGALDQPARWHCRQPFGPRRRHVADLWRHRRANPADRRGCSPDHPDLTGLPPAARLA